MRAHPELWSYTLTSQDITELDAAVEAVQRDPRLELETASPRTTLTSDAQQASGIGNSYINLHTWLTKQEQFVLPRLGPKLTAFRNEVTKGMGFQLIRGVPVQRYSREQTIIAYWGMGLYWGTAVTQNKKGHLIGHVKDIGFDIKNPETRIYGTALAQPYHTDISDVVGLLALQNAKEGGLSSWSSSITVHNELIKRGRMDLVRELAGPQWWLDRKGEVPAGKKPYFRLPIFNYHKGYLAVCFSDTYYQLAQRHPEVPRLTPLQWEALRAYVALAKSDLLRMDLELQPGDIQLLSNTQMLHTRSAFMDDPDPEKRRHLLRLWVSPEDGQPLPEEYAELWDNVEPGKRGGLKVPGYRATIPLEAE